MGNKFFVIWFLSVMETSSNEITIEIAHINDHHSHLEPSVLDLVLAGNLTRVQVGGFAALATLFENLPKGVLKIHAGDAMTGTMYHTFFKGRADAALMKKICFDIFTLGNHEFDDGDDVLRRFLDLLKSDTCNSSVLSANIIPKIGTPLAPNSIIDYFRPWTNITVNGTTLAVAGITVRNKTVMSSRPLTSTVFLDEVASAQAAVDEIRLRGFTRVILTTHIGYAADLHLAASLRGVDVIIGGDSHTLLGDGDGLGMPIAGPYPTVARDRDGKMVCVGQAWEYAKAFALMRVTFDAHGDVLNCGGQVSLPVLADYPQWLGFLRTKGPNSPWEIVGPAEEKAIRSALTIDDRRSLRARLVEPSARALGVVQGFSASLAQLRHGIVGISLSTLCLVRIPGSAGNLNPNTEACLEQTREQGSPVSQVVAEAMLAASKRASIAIQNAGGIRAGIQAGNITYEAILTVLPFSNTLVELDMLGWEIRATLEEAAQYAQSTGGGSHPYAAGLRWCFDPYATTGSWFSDLQVRSGTAGAPDSAWTPMEMDQVYTVVTNDFVADGKDGYLFMKNVKDSGRYVNTFMPYSQSLIDYLIRAGAIDIPAPSDFSQRPASACTTCRKCCIHTINLGRPSRSLKFSRDVVLETVEICAPASWGRRAAARRLVVTHRAEDAVRLWQGGSDQTGASCKSLSALEADPLRPGTLIQKVVCPISGRYIRLDTATVAAGWISSNGGSATRMRLCWMAAGGDDRPQIASVVVNTRSPCPL